MDDFHFIKPPPQGGSIHRNLMGNKLQLQVDIFCLEIADAVDAWAASVKHNKVIQDRMASLLVIHDGVPFVKYIFTD